MLLSRPPWIRWGVYCGRLPGTSNLRENAQAGPVLEEKMRISREGDEKSQLQNSIPGALGHGEHDPDKIHSFPLGPRALKIVCGQL